MNHNGVGSCLKERNSASINQIQNHSLNMSNKFSHASTPGSNHAQTLNGFSEFSDNLKKDQIQQKGEAKNEFISSCEFYSEASSRKNHKDKEADARFLTRIQGENIKTSQDILLKQRFSRNQFFSPQVQPNSFQNGALNMELSKESSFNQNLGENVSISPFQNQSGIKNTSSKMLPSNNYQKQIVAYDRGIPSHILEGGESHLQNGLKKLLSPEPLSITKMQRGLSNPVRNEALSMEDRNQKSEYQKSNQRGQRNYLDDLISTAADNQSNNQYILPLKSPQQQGQGFYQNPVNIYNQVNPRYSQSTSSKISEGMTQSVNHYSVNPKLKDTHFCASTKNVYYNKGYQTASNFKEGCINYDQISPGQQRAKESDKIINLSENKACRASTEHFQLILPFENKSLRIGNSQDHKSKEQNLETMKNMSQQSPFSTKNIRNLFQNTTNSPISKNKELNCFSQPPSNSHPFVTQQDNSTTREFNNTKSQKDNEVLLNSASFFDLKSAEGTQTDLKGFKMAKTIESIGNGLHNRVDKMFRHITISELQQTSSSQNCQQNSTKQSFETQNPQQGQVKQNLSSFWSMSKFSTFSQEFKNYSSLEVSKIESNLVILLFSDAFREEYSFLKSLIMMHFQYTIQNDSNSPNQFNLFSIFQLVKSKVIRLLPDQNNQAEEAALINSFTNCVNELTDLKPTHSSEAIFEKFIQLFTQDQLFCKAVILATKFSVALICNSDEQLRQQASQYLWSSSQSWFDMKKDFLQLYCEGLNVVIEMYYLLNNQIEIESYSPKNKVSQQSTEKLRFVYYFDTSQKRQFFLPLLTLENSLVFSVASSPLFLSHNNAHFLSQLTQQSMIEKSKSLKSIINEEQIPKELPRHHSFHNSTLSKDDTKNKQQNVENCSNFLGSQQQQYLPLLKDNFTNNTIVEQAMKSKLSQGDSKIENQFLSKNISNDINIYLQKGGRFCENNNNIQGSKYSETLIRPPQDNKLNIQDVGKYQPSKIFQNSSDYRISSQSQNKRQTVFSDELNKKESDTQPQYQFNPKKLSDRLISFMLICKDNTLKIENKLKFQISEQLPNSQPTKSLFSQNPSITMGNKIQPSQNYNSGNDSSSENLVPQFYQINSFSSNKVQSPSQQAQKVSLNKEFQKEAENPSQLQKGQDINGNSRQPKYQSPYKHLQNQEQMKDGKIAAVKDFRNQNNLNGGNDRQVNYLQMPYSDFPIQQSKSKLQPSKIQNHENLKQQIKQGQQQSFEQQLLKGQPLSSQQQQYYQQPSKQKNQIFTNQNQQILTSSVKNQTITPNNNTENCSAINQQYLTGNINIVNNSSVQIPRFNNSNNQVSSGNSMFSSIPKQNAPLSGTYSQHNYLQSIFSSQNQKY